MKNIVNEIKEIQDEIAYKKEYILHLQEVATATTVKLSSLPKARITQKIEILTTEKTTVENEILALQEKMVDSQIKLTKFFAEKIKDRDTYSVMINRYVYMKKFQKIENDLHFSESTTFRLHRKGLKILGLK